MNANKKITNTLMLFLLFVASNVQSKTIISFDEIKDDELVDKTASYRIVGFDDVRLSSSDIETYKSTGFRTIRLASYKDDPKHIRSTTLLEKNYKNSNSNSVVYALEIGVSKGGEKSIYLQTNEGCKEKNLLEELIIKVDGKKVKHDEFCDGQYKYYTPKTTAGSNYVVGELMKKDMVLYEFKNLVPFNTTGFKTAWYSFDDDVL